WTTGCLYSLFDSTDRKPTAAAPCASPIPYKLPFFTPRGPGLFRLFEKLVHPYPEQVPQDLPKGFFAFLWACTAGLRRYLLAFALLVAAFNAYEAWLFSVLGRLVDWLTQTQPGRLWDEQQHAITLFVVILLASTALLAGYTTLKHQVL